MLPDLLGDMPILEANEADGLLLSAKVTIQCTEPLDPNDLESELCGEAIEGAIDVASHDEIPHLLLRCPKCSERTGADVLIPVALLVGYEVEDELGEDEEPDVRTVMVLEADGSTSTERVELQPRGGDRSEAK